MSRAGILLAAALGTGIAISGVIVYLHDTDLEEHGATCTRAKLGVHHRLNQEDLQAAREALAAARTTCGDDAELADLDRRIQARIAELEREKAQQKVERERDAAAHFPERAAAARTLLREATKAVTRNDIQTAAGKYVQTRGILEEFKGTAVEQGAEFIALRGEAEKVRIRVQPHLDEVRAAIEEAKRQLAAQAQQDRRDGVKITRDGYVAAVSREKLDRAFKYIAAGDREGFALLVEEDPEVVILGAGVRVVPIERAGVLGSVVRVRVRGTLDEFWTVPEALRDP